MLLSKLSSPTSGFEAHVVSERERLLTFALMVAHSPSALARCCVSLVVHVRFAHKLVT